MQTSIEWLYAELAKNNNSNDSIKERIYRQAQIWKDAKEMHRNEIVNSYVKGQALGFDDNPNYMAEQYYEQTFVSKGSDDVDFPQQEISDNSPKEVKKDSFGEISDEEIEKSAKEWYEKEGMVHYNAEIKAWVSACKWYREQLKTKKD
jgi:hypothetical protein